MEKARPPVKFSYEDYCTLPEGSRYQLIEGDLVMSPAPSRRHQRIVTDLTTALNLHVKAKGLGEVYGAPIDVKLSDEDVAQPDVVFVSKARASILVDEGIGGGPDLCVEVLSPGSEKLDRGAKRGLYARHGVEEYWIVDPDGDGIEIYRFQESTAAPVRTLTAQDRLETPLLPGFTLELSDLFAR